MEKGDIVHVEYEMWIKGPKNELFSTNIESVAKAENKYDDKMKYVPMPFLMGYNRYMKGLEDSIIKAEVGKEYSVEISSVDGAGDRDPAKVKVYSMRDILRLPEFQKKNAKYPEVGMDINIEGKIATITGLYAGRARVDFNDKLAGKTVNYKYKVVKKDENLDEKARSVIEMEYGNSNDFIVVVEKDDSVTITLPDICKYDPVWFKAKYLLVADMRDILNIKLIRFVEEYRKKEEKKEDKPEDKKEEPKDKIDDKDIKSDEKKPVKEE